MVTRRTPYIPMFLSNNQNAHEHARIIQNGPLTIVSCDINNIHSFVRKNVACFLINYFPMICFTVGECLYAWVITPLRLCYFSWLMTSPCRNVVVIISDPAGRQTSVGRRRAGITGLKKENNTYSTNVLLSQWPRGYQPCQVCRRLSLRCLVKDTCSHAHRHGDSAKKHLCNVQVV